MGLLDTFARVFHSGRDFQNRIRAAAEQVGVQCFPDDEDEDVAGLAARYDGTSYTVMAHREGDKVILRALSNVRFRPGRLPAAIACGLQERNRKLPRFDWDALDGRKCAFFFVKAQARLAAFDAELLGDALREMLPEVAAFDAVLEREGYVN